MGREAVGGGGVCGCVVVVVMVVFSAGTGARWEGEHIYLPEQNKAAHEPKLIT